MVCGIGPEIRTLDGDKGFHGTGVTYLPSLLGQYPPPNQSLYPPPPPQLPTVSTTTDGNNETSRMHFHLSEATFDFKLIYLTIAAIPVLDRSGEIVFFFWNCDSDVGGVLLQCVLPAGVEFYSSGFDANDALTSPRSYPIVLTGKS